MSEPGKQISQSPSRGKREDERPASLPMNVVTRRDRTWQMSSGTSQMVAPSFLAMLMLSLAFEICLVVGPAGRDEVVVRRSCLFMPFSTSRRNTPVPMAGSLKDRIDEFRPPLRDISLAHLTISLSVISRLPRPLRQRRQRQRDVLAHELPDQAERQRLLPVREVCALDADEREAVLLPELDGCSLCSRPPLNRSISPPLARRLVDVPPVDRALDDLVVRLAGGSSRLADRPKKDTTAGCTSRLLRPEREDPSLALPSASKSVHLGLFFLRDRVERRVCVEQGWQQRRDSASDCQQRATSASGIFGIRACRRSEVPPRPAAAGLVFAAERECRPYSGPIWAMRTA